MTEHKYLYANMAIQHQHDGSMDFYVVRLWHENLDHPERICYTPEQADAELISEALNATLKLTGEQANSIVAEWMKEATQWKPQP